MIARYDISITTLVGIFFLKGLVERFFTFFVVCSACLFRQVDSWNSCTRWSNFMFGCRSKRTLFAFWKSWWFSSFVEYGEEGLFAGIFKFMLHFICWNKISKLLFRSFCILRKWKTLFVEGFGSVSVTFSGNRKGAKEGEVVGVGGWVRWLQRNSCISVFHDCMHQSIFSWTDQELLRTMYKNVLLCQDFNCLI